MVSVYHILQADASAATEVGDSHCQDKIKIYKNFERCLTAIFPFPSALPHPLLRESGISRNPGALSQLINPGAALSQNHYSTMSMGPGPFPLHNVSVRNSVNLSQGDLFPMLHCTMHNVR